MQGEGGRAQGPEDQSGLLGWWGSRLVRLLLGVATAPARPAIGVWNWANTVRKRGIIDSLDDWGLWPGGSSYVPRHEAPEGSLQRRYAKQRQLWRWVSTGTAVGLTILSLILLAVLGLPAPVVVFVPFISVLPASYLLMGFLLNRLAPQVFAGNLIGNLLSEEQQTGGQDGAVSDQAMIYLFTGRAIGGTQGRAPEGRRPPRWEAVHAMYGVAEARSLDQAIRWFGDAGYAIETALADPELSAAHREGLFLVRVYLGVQLLNLASRFHSLELRRRGIENLEEQLPALWRKELASGPQVRLSRVNAVRLVALASAYFQRHWNETRSDEDLRQARTYWSEVMDVLDRRDPNFTWALDQHNQLTMVLQLALHDEDIAYAEQHQLLEAVDDPIAEASQVLDLVVVAVHASKVTTVLFQGGLRGLSKFLDEDRSTRITKIRDEVRPFFDEAWQRLQTVTDAQDRRLAFVRALREIRPKVGAAVDALVQTLEASQSDPMLEARGGEAAQESAVRGRSADRSRDGPKPLEGVRHIIAVASNKGGVGKSTVAVNLALALRRHGKRVGLLDADLTGPNHPTMLGLALGSQAETGLNIVERYGLWVASSGFVLKARQAATWRGPMISAGLRQLLDLPWSEAGELDYLIVDMPPGTSDASLSLAREVPMACVVMVTTPAEVSLEDAARAVTMFEKLNVPVFGVIENMSHFVCPECGEQHNIFGAYLDHDEAKATERTLGSDILGSIPLDPSVAEGAVTGVPVVEGEPDSPVTATMIAVAQQIMARISELEDFSKPPAGDEPG